MEIKKLVVGQLQTNCYLVWREDKKVTIIDPGDDAEYIENTIQDLRLKPKIILATHGHYDHILAVTELRLAYQIPWAIHKADLPLVFHSRQIKPDRFLQDKEMIEGLKVTYFGEHSPGSVGFFSRKDKVIFSGDVLPSNKKFLKLPRETLVFSGHGESFVLADWQ